MECCTGDPLQCHICHKTFNNRQSKYRHAKKCTETESVVNSAPVTNTNSTITGDHNNMTNTIDNSVKTDNVVNITINNFGSERTDYITDAMIQKCFECGVRGIETMLEAVYFNKDHPENHNVKVRSFRNTMVDVFKDQQWIPRGLQDTIERMMISSAVRITSKIPTLFPEPTQNILDDMKKLQDIDSKAKRRIFGSAKSHLQARRDNANK
jgi:hypothetical protein